MAEQQQINPELIDQARREINRLVGEIEQLSARDMPPADFHVEFLRRTHVALAAEASALWLRNPQGHMQLACHINLPATGVTTDEALRPTHDELLRCAVTRGEPMVLAPNAGPIGEEFAGVLNATSYLLVLAPIMLDDQPLGVVEVFQDAERRSGAAIGYQRFLSRVALEVSKYHKNRRFRQFIGQEKIWKELDTYIRSVHAGHSPRETAYLIANDGRRLIGCERVSVALKKGRNTQILAISGQDTVERKSNLVRRMARLAGTVLRHGENLVYLGAPDPNWPRDVTRSLGAYVEESNSRLVAVVPLADERTEKRRSAKPSAALIVEMIEDEALPDDLVGRIEVVAKHGSLALYNNIDTSRIFLLPVWRALGKTSHLFTGSRLPLTSTIMALIAALGLFLTFFPWPLRLEGKGELTPRTKRRIYAPMQGIVEEVKVDYRTPVQPGAEVLVLSNAQLASEMFSNQKELQAKTKALEQLQAAKDQPNRNKSDVDRDNAAILQHQTEIEHLNGKIRLLNDQLSKLRLASTIQGQVLSWNPKEKLTQRPVQQGETLLEIAETDGEWIVEVQFPEKVVAHIAKAKAAAAGGNLPVSMMLSSVPEKTFTGVIYELATQASPVEKENVVLAKIRLDKPMPEEFRRAGAEMRVKAECGPHAVGYVLFRELIDYVREKVFF